MTETAVAAAGLASVIRGIFAQAASYLALLTENNPRGSAASLTSRPDVEAVLGAAFEEARQAAREAVQAAWAEHTPTGGDLLYELLSDVDKAYSEAAMAHLRGRIHHAWASVALQHFVQGVSTPGTHPEQASAQQRAQAVRNAVESFAANAGLRNSLSADVARGVARTVTQLEQPGAFKRWRTSKQPPDATTCYWCRKLNGTVVPVGNSFAHQLGGAVDIAGHGHLTQPPKPYLGWLQGPPLHPHCRCHLEILEDESVSQEGDGQEPGSPPQSGFLSATEIRAMPEERYQSLIGFLRAAAHELGQVLRRLGKAGRG